MQGFPHRDRDRGAGNSSFAVSSREIECRNAAPDGDFLELTALRAGALILALLSGRAAHIIRRAGPDDPPRGAQDCPTVIAQRFSMTRELSEEERAEFVVEVERLRQEHRDLDAAIDALMAVGARRPAAIAALEKAKAAVARPDRQSGRRSDARYHRLSARRRAFTAVFSENGAFRENRTFPFRRVALDTSPSIGPGPKQVPSSKPSVAIIMGSQSDWATMRHASETLEALGVEADVRIVSAHRTPDRLVAFAKGAREAGLQGHHRRGGRARPICRA